MGAENQAVNRAILERIRPHLEAAGFEDFTARKAWRRSGHATEVLDFQAVGTYAAFSVGCTPFSFSVRAGVRYAECEEQDRIPAAQTTRPGYEHCTFQAQLGKRLRQPYAFRSAGNGLPQDRADIWAVNQDASNVRDAIADAAETLMATGLPLLAELGSPDLAYAALLTRDSSEVAYGVPSVEMPGAPGSPRWLDTVRCLAARLGRDADEDVASAPVLRARRP